MGPHETHEHIEHAEHAQHAEHKSGNKRTAILIILLAASLAISEMLGKEAMFTSLGANIEASDTWAFYQAKTIRAALLKTAGQTAALLPPDIDGQTRDTTLAGWKKEIDHLNSEPATHEGRKELVERAKTLTETRDHKMHAYHDYEFSTAAFELAIVMASTAVITGFAIFEFIAAGLGLAGLAFGVVGWLAPALISL